MKHNLPIVVAAAGVLVGVGIVQWSGNSRDEPFCSGEVLQVGEPLYRGGTEGHPTAEEAARSGVRLLLTEELAETASEAEWNELPLEAVGSDSGTYAFRGNITSVVPGADRDRFTVRVSGTPAGGYLFVGGSVCLTGE